MDELGTAATGSRSSTGLDNQKTATGTGSQKKEKGQNAAENEIYWGKKRGLEMSGRGKPSRKVTASAGQKGRGREKDREKKKKGKDRSVLQKTPIDWGKLGRLSAGTHRGGLEMVHTWILRGTVTPSKKKKREGEKREKRYVAWDQVNRTDHGGGGTDRAREGKEGTKNRPSTSRGCNRSSGVDRTEAGRNESSPTKPEPSAPSAAGVPQNETPH